MKNRSANGVEAAEASRRALEIATRYRPANKGRRHRMAIGSGDRIDHRYPESIPFAEGAKNVDVARPLAPEAVIVSDEELAQPKPAAKHMLDEVFGGERGQLRRKWKYRDVVDPCFSEHFQLLVPGREEKRSGGGIYDVERMRVESDQNARSLERARPRDQTLDNIPMAAVNAVERSYGYDGAFDVRRQSGFVRGSDSAMHRAPREAVLSALDQHQEHPASRRLGCRTLQHACAAVS